MIENGIFKLGQELVVRVLGDQRMDVVFAVGAIVKRQIAGVQTLLRALQILQFLL